MKILQEFKEFAVKGNVIDLAVGVIIGGAFGKVVTSLVNDIIMPPVGALINNTDFKDLMIPIGEAPLLEDGTLGVHPGIYIGSFINTILDFLIVALCIFFMVKGINHLRRITEKEKVAEVKAPTEKECPHCLSQVPIKATRCKHCTSHLVNATISE